MINITISDHRPKGEKKKKSKAIDVYDIIKTTELQLACNHSTRGRPKWLYIYMERERERERV